MSVFGGSDRKLRLKSQAGDRQRCETSLEDKFSLWLAPRILPIFFSRRRLLGKSWYPGMLFKIVWSPKTILIVQNIAFPFRSVTFSHSWFSCLSLEAEHCVYLKQMSHTNLVALATFGRVVILGLALWQTFPQGVQKAAGLGYFCWSFCKTIESLRSCGGGHLQQWNSCLELAGRSTWGPC